MERTRERLTIADRLRKAVQLVAGIFHALGDKAGGRLKSAPLAEEAGTIRMREAERAQVDARLKKLLEHGSSSPYPQGPPLSAAERKLADSIRSETDRQNRNNETRTGAYLAFWRQFPEVHWAFLAHMVSRNGGWNMTDLKGDLLPRLLDVGQTEAVFRMLEGCNSLIFRDAYPQLLLYRESKRMNLVSDRLLPIFGVSSFMGPFWEVFRETGDSALLTVGLIVNEQSVIQKRIVEDPFYQENVLNAPFLQAQALMQLNQVVFPYREDASLLRHELPWRLAGLVLENFADRDERILFGMKLYALLFGIPAVREGAAGFARLQSHTGSRADYWPQLFTRVRHSPPKPITVERLSGCGLAAGAEPLYSPELAHAWKNRELPPPQPGDWFQDAGPLDYLHRPLTVPKTFEISEAHCDGLKKLELAAMAADTIGKIGG